MTKTFKRVIRNVTKLNSQPEPPITAPQAPAYHPDFIRQALSTMEIANFFPCLPATCHHRAAFAIETRVRVEETGCQMANQLGTVIAHSHTACPEPEDDADPAIDEIYFYMESYLVEFDDGRVYEFERQEIGQP